MRHLKALACGLATLPMVLGGCTSNADDEQVGENADEVVAVESGTRAPCSVALLRPVSGPMTKAANPGPYLGQFFVADLILTNTGKSPLPRQTMMTVSARAADGGLLYSKSVPVAQGLAANGRAPLPLTLGRDLGELGYFGKNFISVTFSCGSAGGPARVEFSTTREATTEQKMTCGAFAASSGLEHAKCEWNGNQACGGKGVETLDCAHCCAEQGNR